MGTYFAGRFHLLVARDYQVGSPYPSGDPSDEITAARYAEELTYFPLYFQAVSDEIFRATSGALALGYVFFLPEGWDSTQLDVSIVNDGGAESLGRLWNLSNAITITRNRLTNVGQLVHELGHYLLDLHDEYKGPGGSGVHCVAAANRSTIGACFMDNMQTSDFTGWALHVTAAGHTLFSKLGDLLDVQSAAVAPYSAGFHAGKVRNFCWRAASGATTVHDKDASSDQNAGHPLAIGTGGQSCWETMEAGPPVAGFDYGLVAPSAAPALPAEDPPEITWVELLPVQRYVLVLDRSGSMFGTKMEALRSGASYWVEHVETGEELGLVSFSGTSTKDHDIEAVPLDIAAANLLRSQFGDAIRNLLANGSTYIGDALMRALGMISALPDAASHSIVLFSDGNQTTGALQPEDVLPALIAKRVRVFVIALGNDADHDLLMTIAETTRGAYLAIPDTSTVDTVDALVRSAFEQFAAIARNQEDVLAATPMATLSIAAGLPHPPWPQPMMNNFWPFPMPGPPPDPPWDVATATKLIMVSRGSSKLVIGVSGMHNTDQLGLQILRPDGSELVPGSKVRVSREGQRFKMFVVRNPEAGVWTVRVREQDAIQSSLRLFASEVNARVKLVVTPERGPIAPGEDARIRIELRTPLRTRIHHLRVLASEAQGWSEHAAVLVSGEQDLAERGDIAAVYEVVIPGAHMQSGTRQVLIDAAHEAGKARYPLEPVCGSDTPPLTVDTTRPVTIGNILRRRRVTLTYAAPNPHARMYVAGLGLSEPDVSLENKRWKRPTIGRPVPGGVPAGPR